MNYCDSGGWMVNRHPLPTDGGYYDVASLPTFGCNRIRCRYCGALVRSCGGIALRPLSAPDCKSLFDTDDLSKSSLFEPSTYRFYVCKCGYHQEDGYQALAEENPEWVDSTDGWRCDGHEVAVLPREFDGVTVTAENLRGIAADALRGWLPPAVLEEDKKPAYWMARLHSRLAQTEQADALARAVAEGLEDEDETVRTRALRFFELRRLRPLPLEAFHAAFLTSRIGIPFRGLEMLRSAEEGASELLRGRLLEQQQEFKAHNEETVDSVLQVEAILEKNCLRRPAVRPQTLDQFVVWAGEASKRLGTSVPPDSATAAALLAGGFFGDLLAAVALQSIVAALLEAAPDHRPLLEQAVVSEQQRDQAVQRLETTLRHPQLSDAARAVLQACLAEARRAVATDSPAGRHAMLRQLLAALNEPLRELSAGSLF